jgi:hypothetical protein
LSDKGGEQLWARETVRDALGFEDLIGEFGTGLKSERFRKDEGIITVEEDFFDLSVKGRLTMEWERGPSIPLR